MIINLLQDEQEHKNVTCRMHRGSNPVLLKWIRENFFYFLADEVGKIFELNLED
jgi:hypothetical protein